MTSTWPVKVSQDVSIRPFKSCTFWIGASIVPDQIEMSCFPCDENIILLKESTAICGYCCSEGVYLVYNSVKVGVRLTSTWMPGPQVYQSLVHGLTLPPLACILPIMHPAANLLPSKMTYTDPDVHMILKKTWFIRLGHILSLLHVPVLLSHLC